MRAVQTVIVSAAVLLEEGRVLLSQRKAGTHLAGAWEFPGGKVEPGEDPKVALERELKEEVGIEVDVLDIADVTFHRYEEKAVLLLFYFVRRTVTSAEPRALDVAAVRWAAARELNPKEFPPADISVLQKVHSILTKEAP